MCHTPGGAEAEAGAAAGAVDQAAVEAGGGGDVGFADDVLPLLEADCASCHGDLALGGLQMTDYDTLMAGGQSGPVVVAGSPDESLIVTKMEEEHPAVLTGDDLGALFDWITAGAENNWSTVTIVEQVCPAHVVKFVGGVALCKKMFL